MLRFLIVIGLKSGKFLGKIKTAFGEIIAMGMALLLLLLGFWFKLVLRWLCWYYIGCVSITLVALVFRW